MLEFVSVVLVVRWGQIARVVQGPVTHLIWIMSLLGVVMEHHDWIVQVGVDYSCDIEMVGGQFASIRLTIMMISRWPYAKVTNLLTFVSVFY